jgi:uncharacterized protein DUF5916/cellulose/xylan binding protein with CBM9 domain
MSSAAWTNVVSICGGLLFLSRLAIAQRPAQPPKSAGTIVVTASKVRGTITIDGSLDEPEWWTTPASSAFRESYPSPGSVAPDQTEFRVLYDAVALYVGIRMFDPHPDSIAAQLARRDATGTYSDWVHVNIDSYHDRRTAFRFSVNPRGVKRDVYVFNDGNEDANWDAVWDVATRIDSAGWVAEFRIPLSQLRFHGTNGPQEWGFQVQREIARRSERDTWSPWTPEDPGFVSRFGDLVGLLGVASPVRLEIVPYTSTRITKAPGDPEDPLFKRTQQKLSGGTDVRYGLPAGLTLAATVNPDFGQVEVDPSVLNLSTFETFFPEKRPFFLEGSGIFTFGQVYVNNDYSFLRYFYSRRIGRQPQLFPSGPSIRFAHVPDQTPIAAAAKVTGKTGDWTIGVLDAVTTGQKGDVVTTSGARLEVPVEPLTNYFAGRLKRDFRNGQSVIGAILTSTARNLRDTVFHNSLRSSATFGGVDFEHDFMNKSYIASGFLSGSRVVGDSAAIAATQLSSEHYFQRPDSRTLRFDQTRQLLGGHLGEIAIAKTGGTYGSLAYKEASPGFEIDDLGFEQRSDFRAFSTDLAFQDFTAGNLFRDFGVYGFTNHAWNFDGNSIFQYIGGGAVFDLADFWNIGTSVGFNPVYLSDRFTRGGPLAIVPSGWNASVSMGSDSRKAISLSGSTGLSRDQAGSRSWYGTGAILFRPATSLLITLGPTLGVNKNAGQFVSTKPDPLATRTFGQRYIFAELHQTSLSMETRVEWTFTRDLTLQSYVQPFVSAGTYLNFKEFAEPHTFRFEVYGRDKGTISRDASTYTVDPDGEGPAPNFTFANPDFNVRNLRGNAVLRWEYRPGSALFFVWQQQRNGFESVGDFDAKRDVGAIFRTTPTNVFLVKVTYWIGS